MKQTRISLLALFLCVTLLLPSLVMAGEVTPEDFLAMAEDAQAQYLQNSGLSYEEAAGYVQCDSCGNWYQGGYEFDIHDCDACSDGGADLPDTGYVQCGDCGGWYMNGTEFRNHFCTGNPENPSSSWTNEDDYYDALVKGDINSDTIIAIGTLYVNTANGKGLNLRTRPSTKGDIQLTIPNGSAVTLFWYENSTWAFVAYRSYFGFCMTRHLSEQEPQASTASTGTANDPSKMYNGFKHVSYRAAVKPSTPTGFVNLRWAPSKSADVQCIYYADTVLQVLATNGTWSQVYNEQTNQCGFMMNAYLNKLLD